VSGQLDEKFTQEPTDSYEERLRKAAEELQAVTVPDDWEPLPVDPNYAQPLVRHLRYRGTVMLNWHLMAGCLEFWAKFQARPSDVVVASFPKSGTTWLQELVWRVVHGVRGADSSQEPLEYRFPVLEMPSRKEMQMRDVLQMTERRLLKTHLPYHLLPGGLPSSGAKILYVSRDVRDVCVSYYHFSRMVNYEMYRGTFSEYRDAFMRGTVMNGPYREHVKGYLDHADSVLCVTYEQLHSDRAEVVRKVAKFLGCTLTDADVEDVVSNTSFAEMKRNPGTNFRHWEENGFAVKDEEGTFMRKGKVGDWRNYFTEEESEAFMKWRNEPI